MIRNVKSLFSKLHNKLVLYIISFIGFSSATNSDDMVQPEYGVRVMPDYGPPQVSKLYYYISGNVSSSKNEPLSNVKVGLSIDDTLRRETMTNELGNYIMRLDYSDLQNKTARLSVTDIIKTDSVEYEKKDSTFKLNFESSELFWEINFKLNEKRK